MTRNVSFNNGQTLTIDADFSEAGVDKTVTIAYAYEGKAIYEGMS